MKQIAEFVAVKSKRNGSFKVIHAKIMLADGETDQVETTLADSIASKEIARSIAKSIGESMAVMVDGEDSVSTEEMLARR